MSLTVSRVDWSDTRAVDLRASMDAESNARYVDRVAALSGGPLAALAAALRADGTDVVTTLLAMDGTVPVGHAALRPTVDASPGVLEVKKVFVPPTQRRRGISRLLMDSLADDARERGATRLVLQTGDLQHEAIALYERLGYRVIPAFGLYGAVPFAVCYELEL